MAIPSSSTASSSKSHGEFLLTDFQPGPLRSWLGAAGWVALCVGGGALIGVFTAGGDSAWYRALNKPSWNPPSDVFAPVWTTLYAMMGVAAWRVWRMGGWARHATALNLFLAQLTLNFGWSILFFSVQTVTGALVDIVVLWALIAATIWSFWRIDRVAAWLLLPYLAWVSFAAALNATIAALN